MKKEKKPLFSDRFLDELAKEINQYYSVPEADYNQDGGLEGRDADKRKVDVKN